MEPRSKRGCYFLFRFIFAGVVCVVVLYSKSLTIYDVYNVYVDDATQKKTSLILVLHIVSALYLKTTKKNCYFSYSRLFLRDYNLLSNLNLNNVCNGQNNNPRPDTIIVSDYNFDLDTQNKEENSFNPSTPCTHIHYISMCLPK